MICTEGGEDCLIETIVIDDAEIIVVPNRPEIINITIDIEGPTIITIPEVPTEVSIGEVIITGNSTDDGESCRLSWYTEYDR